MRNAVEVLIDGVDWSPRLATGSVSVQSSVGGISQATFEISDFSGTWFPPRGSRAQINIRNPWGEESLADGFMLDAGMPGGYPEALTLFGGTIRRWDMHIKPWDRIETTDSFLLDGEMLDSQIPNPQAGTFWQRSFTVTCTDFSHWLKRVVIDDSPSWSSQSIKVIVKAIINTYMAAFGIHVVFYDEGPTISYAITRPITVADALNEISALSGDPPMVYWMDEFANLYMAYASSRMCPFKIDSGYTFHYGITEVIDISESDENYRNREVLVLEDGTVVTDSDAGEITAWGQWDKIEERRGTDAGTAALYAEAQLRKFKTDKTAKLQLLDHGARPGQIINVYLPSLGLEGQYGITSVRANIGPDWMTNGTWEANVRYEIEISRSGELLSDFREFFTRKLRQ